MVIKAEDAVYGGYVIARDGGVVFIRGAIPGELVEVSVTERKRDYSVASVTGVVEPSDHRVKPWCVYFGRCGGCQLQFVSYEKQVSMKNHVLADCLERIGGIQTELLEPLSGSDSHYRHRAQFKVSREGEIGFFREGTRDVVPVAECPVMVKEINDALRRITESGVPGVREIHVTSGDCLVALIKGAGFNEDLAEAFINAGFAGVAFDDYTYRGSGHVTLDLDGLNYTVSPWSFFQSNWALNRQVAGLISGGLGSPDGMRVLDLYAGAGNFSLCLARAGADVVAVEDSPHSIKDGERNAAINGLQRFRFVRGRAETAKFKGGFHALILDPPRPGLTRAAMERVLAISPQRVAYVSCNPSTFARDLKKLREKYEIDSIRMVDFFPNTYHVESLAFLTIK